MEAPERTRVRLIRTPAGRVTPQLASAGPVVMAALVNRLAGEARYAVAAGPVVMAVVTGPVAAPTRAEALRGVTDTTQAEMEAIRVVLRQAPVTPTLDREADNECYLKSESETYSFADLERKRRKFGDGVTNGVAVNRLRGLKPA